MPENFLDMKSTAFNRRQFIQRSAMAAGALILSGCAGLKPAAKRAATDQVILGKTGLRISRLGFGTGSNSGQVQKELGQQAFNDLIHYAYDQGITYFDCAQSYQTFEWIAGAIKGLPREKLFIQSKIGGKPDKILEAIDNHRSVFKTDYVDSMLIHCMVKDGWTDSMKRIMDGFDEALRVEQIPFFSREGGFYVTLTEDKIARYIDEGDEHSVHFFAPYVIWAGSPIIFKTTVLAFSAAASDTFGLATTAGAATVRVGLANAARTSVASLDRSSAMPSLDGATPTCSPSISTLASLAGTSMADAIEDMTSSSLLGSASATASIRTPPNHARSRCENLVANPPSLPTFIASLTSVSTS